VKNAAREVGRSAAASAAANPQEPPAAGADWEGDTYTEQEESERIFRDLNRDSMSEEDMLTVLECF